MKRLFSILLVGFVMLMAGCTPSDEPIAKPQLTLTKGVATEVSLTFTVETKSVDKVAYFYTDNVAEVPSAETLLTDGVSIEGNKATEVEIDGLEAGVTYTIVVAASGGGEIISQSIDMTTKTKAPEPTPEPEYLFDMEMATASRIPSAELDLEDNYFAIAFADENEEHTLGIVLVGDGTHNSILTEEVYSAANETLMIEGCEFYTTDGEYYFVDGEVVAVQADGAAYVYSFDITLEDEEGNLFHFTYEGEGSADFNSFSFA